MTKPLARNLQFTTMVHTNAVQAATIQVLSHALASKDRELETLRRQLGEMLRERAGQHTYYGHIPGRRAP